MDEWLVSVVKEGKVVELYFSDELEDLDTIRAMHKGCVVESIRIARRVNAVKVKDVSVSQGVKRRSKRIRCIENGIIYESSAECAKILGIHRDNIYKSISRGITAGGYHFEYFDNQ